MFGVLSLFIIVTLASKKTHQQVKNHKEQIIEPIIQAEQLLKQEDYYLDVENFLDSEIEQLIKESDLNQQAEQILSNKQDDSFISDQLKIEINKQNNNIPADIQRDDILNENQEGILIQVDNNQQQEKIYEQKTIDQQQQQNYQNQPETSEKLNCQNVENCETEQKNDNSETQQNNFAQQETTNNNQNDNQQHNSKINMCSGDSQNDDNSKGCQLADEKSKSQSPTFEQQNNNLDDHHDHNNNNDNSDNSDNNDHNDHSHDQHIHDHDYDHHNNIISDVNDDIDHHNHDHNHDHNHNHNHNRNHDKHHNHNHHNHHHHHHEESKFDHKHDQIEIDELTEVFSQVQFPDLSFIFDKQKIQKHLTDYLPTDKYLAMIYGVILTQLPSFPTFLILLAVLKGKKQLGNKSVLNNMIAFSFGTMLGDVFFHMLPQIQEQEHILDIHDIHDAHESHSHTLSYPTLYIILGILIFVFIDLITIKIQESQRLARKKNKNKKRNQKKNQKNKQKEEENLTQAKTKTAQQEEQGKKQTKKQDKKQPAENKTTESKTSNEKEQSDHSEKQDENQDEQDNHDNDHHDHSHDSGNSIMTFLFCDFLHNITDGIALGATFSLGIKQGIVTTIAIFFHEIPHEIGDFAYLIKRNQSIFKVFLTQVATSAGCFLGAIFSFQYSQSHQFELLCLTCGSFIYVSLTNILPEIKFGFAFKPSLKRLFKQMFSIIFGLFLMYKVGQLE